MGKVVGTMIALPPGCTVTYAVYVEVDQLTDEMVEWYELIGGRITEDRWYDTRGNEQTIKYVSYGRGKRCHRYNNGSKRVKLHFDGADASAASMFIMKFFEHVTSNNLTEVMERHAQETA
jgi:hypothetical protein